MTEIPVTHFPRHCYSITEELCKHGFRGNDKVLISKNLVIANRLHVSCAHNMLRASIGLNITP